jgi:hypothetical protein
VEDVKKLPDHDILSKDERINSITNVDLEVAE